MLKIDSNISTFAIACCVAFCVNALFNSAAPGLSGDGSSVFSVSQARADEAQRPVARWAASATGRIEPKSGAVSISSIVGGRVASIAVDVNDVVKKGDVLVILDEGDTMMRIQAAMAEVAVRELEREEEPVKDLAKERDDAEDAWSKAQRAEFKARLELDRAQAAKRSGDGSDALVQAARGSLKSAQDRVAETSRELAEVKAKDDMPLQTRLQSSVTVARAELSMAEEAFEGTRIRAPFDGTVLNILTRIGETVGPSPENALVSFGDVSVMRVRAEVEERDVAKVQIGQEVIVRADAYPDRDFKGKVTSIASSLGSPRIASRGPRRPNDVDVLEVVAELEGLPPLLTGMRVDVFFKNDGSRPRASAAVTN